MPGSFGIQRVVVYDILRKEKEGDLKDRSKAPKRSPNKTPDEVEDKAIEMKNKTRYGPQRLSIHLKRDITFFMLLQEQSGIS